ncbi:hypothetical protein D9V28_06370 [Mycetocola zhadangensis]|uniref:PIN domain-containing protein n=1 Tax=Mycetocola zhadangensis TaxID=1164595 RepID=A0A3L7J6Y0_9MICO|nr:hypothetical protein D9V28_06370 [Mycetocola zhadangensis]
MGGAGRWTAESRIVDKRICLFASPEASVRVVTNDRALRDRTEVLGVTTCGTGWLLDLLDSPTS